MSNFTIRRATPADIPLLAGFNRAIARETEDFELKPEIITAGVTNFLARPELGFYLVAETEADGAAAVIGSLMITTEWSDWRNSVFWWIQSVYVVAGYRRQGVYRGLYEHVKQLAADTPDVCGFRLYVERENEIAQATYRSLGMERTQYLMFEELKPGVEFTERSW